MSKLWNVLIPTSKVDEIYCDYPKENSKPCRDLGAFQSYTERLKQNKAMENIEEHINKNLCKLEKIKKIKNLPKILKLGKNRLKKKLAK